MQVTFGDRPLTMSDASPCSSDTGTAEQPAQIEAIIRIDNSCRFIWISLCQCTKDAPAAKKVARFFRPGHLSRYRDERRVIPDN